MTAAIRTATVLGLVAAGLLIGPAPPASSHPLGNFTVNAYGGITVGPGWVGVDYVLDLAEIPTFQELSTLDADTDGVVDEEERVAGASRMGRELIRGLSFEVNDRPVPLELVHSRMELLLGQGGLDVLRLEVGYRAPVPRSGRAEFRDANAEGRLGWREISAVGTEGVAVTESNVPGSSISGRLRAYPEDLLSSPLDVRGAAFAFGPGQQVRAGEVEADAGSGRSLPTDAPLVAFVGRATLSMPVVLFGLLAAAGAGALHALAPGHGKTVTAAYLAGSGAGVRQAIGVGVAVSLMHTVSVVAIGGLVLLAQREFPAERVYPWLGMLAGITATALGGGLLISRLRSRDVEHDHSHPHARLSRPRLAAIAASGGLLPSPSALLVLLAAVTFGRVLLGVGLIVAFSLGLAGALVGIGILAVRARDVVLRHSWSRLARALPVASAAAILLVGIFLVSNTVIQL